MTDTNDRVGPEPTNWDAPPRPVHVQEFNKEPAGTDYASWAFLTGMVGLFLGVVVPAINWYFPLLPSALAVGLAIHAMKHHTPRKGMVFFGLVGGVLGLLCTLDLYTMYNDAMNQLSCVEEAPTLGAMAECDG